MLQVIQGFAKLIGFDLERKPSVVATGDMIALGTLQTTFTFFRTSELFEFTVQLLNLPCHVTRVLNDLTGAGTPEIMGDDPVNVAVGGNHLESAHLKGNFLQLDHDPLLQVQFAPLNVCQVNPTFGFQTEQAIRLQTGDKGLI